MALPKKLIIAGEGLHILAKKTSIIGKVTAARVCVMRTSLPTTQPCLLRSKD